ncbi:MAG: DUF2933 domain-containing protein [Candidatus Rokubacteria bacterium]|nr:DUF2933 domain-containing protein [Candidatus Rokubacteria bacterium]
MSEPLHERRLADIATPENGDTPSGARPVPSYCSFCGERARAEGPPVERFGEVFCSVEHADAFVLEVRRARVQTAASVGVPDAQAARESESTTAQPRPGGWKRYLTWAVCCGTPLLAIVILAGGGAALLGAAGGLLPLLGLLACPLAMFFMMRAMSKMEHRDNTKDRRDE